MFPRLPPVTQALLIGNVVVFLLQMLLGTNTFDPFMLWPIGAFDAFSPGQNFQLWQLLTYGFLHGSFSHLLFNMLALYMFGGPLEQTWGNKRFLTYYLVCVVGAGLCQLLVGWWMLKQRQRAVSDPGRLRRHLRPAAGLRHAVPEPAGGAACSRRSR